MYIYIYIYICMYVYVWWTHTSVLPFLLGWKTQVSVPSFEKGGSEKMTVWGNLKSFCHAEYLPRGTCYFSCQKKDFQR